MTDDGLITGLADALKTLLQAEKPAHFPEVQAVYIGRRDTTPEDVVVMIEVPELRKAKSTMGRYDAVFEAALILRTRSVDAEDSLKKTANLAEAVFNAVYRNPTIGGYASGISPFAGGLNRITLGMTSESSIMTREAEITFQVTKTLNNTQ